MKSIAAIKKPNALVKWLRIISFAGAWSGGALSLAGDEPEPARFWITKDPDNPFASGVPTIEAPLGVERKLYIWARPAIDAAGNPKTLQNFSLNLVVPQGRLENPPGNPVDPVVDFLDNSIHVYNDEFSGGKQRFQFVQDSTHAPPPDFDFPLVSNATETQVLDSTCIPPQVLACRPDGIGGDEGTIQGFSIPDPREPAENEKYVGIGHPEDPLRRTQTGQLPAWLIAEVGFKTVRPEGTNPYFLQIGFNGMSHRNESAAQTKVVFSLRDDEPIYEVGIDAHLQSTSADDMPDVRITALAAPSTSPGDFGRDGIVGPEDFWIWKTAFGEAVDPPSSGSDANSNGTVDAADYTFWRDHLSVMPGDFDRNGDAGPEDHALWKNTFGEDVSPGAGADGNGNGTVDAADYTVWRDQFSHLPGNFDGNGVVDIDDYTNWKELFGQPVAVAGTGADANWNGVVDAADYTVWRDYWGVSPGAGPSLSDNSASLFRTTVPEPSPGSFSLVLFLLVYTPRPLIAVRLDRRDADRRVHRFQLLRLGHLRAVHHRRSDACGRAEFTR